MMNVSWALRDHTGFCIPKGPSMRSAKVIKSSIWGTQLKLRAPKHRPRPRMKGYNKMTSPKAYYSQNDVSFDSNFSERFKVADLWEFMPLFGRAWAFNGPWFTGYLGEVEMWASLVRLKQPSDVSYFHPRAFEQTIGNYLTNEHSTQKDYGRSLWIAPVKWQPIDSLPVVATRFQIVRDVLVGPDDREQDVVLFPIDDQVLLKLSFSVSQDVMGDQAEKDASVGRSTMDELVEGIIASLELTLSPEAEAQQAKALEGLEDCSLIKEFPPLKWNSEKDEAEWQQELERRKKEAELFA